MPKRDPLGVWLYGLRVAELTSTGPGVVVCRYTPDALERWPLNTPLLSCSLPLSARPLRGDLFFSGLLPEGQHRQAMAAMAGVPSYDTFGLLARFGRDVAGAAVVAEEDVGPRPGSVVPYSETDLAAEVEALPARPLGLHDDSELSIAGLQDKLLLVRLDDGTWGRPVHGRPSTHILKVEDRRFPGMAELEAGCLRLATAVGLSTVDATVLRVADVPCLVVSRFDRRVTDDGDVERVHDEDACQALARDPEASRGRGKYENAGGPSLREVARLLDRYSHDALGELDRLVRAVVFTVVIGNADAHGKNVSLLHVEPGVVSLAPLYDTVPTVLWPKLRRKAAMSVNGRAGLDRLTIADVVAEAGTWGLDATTARSAAEETAASLHEMAAGLDLPDQLAASVVARAAALSA